MIGMNMLSQAASLVMNAFSFSMISMFDDDGTVFTTSNVYTTVYIYDFLNNIILMLPLMISSAFEANISGKRLQAFLAMPEVDVGLINR